jgi:hypothetical protein
VTEPPTPSTLPHGARPAGSNVSSGSRTTIVSGPLNGAGSARMLQYARHYIEKLVVVVNDDGWLVATRFVRAGIARRSGRFARQILLIFHRNGWLAAIRFALASLRDSTSESHQRWVGIAPRRANGRRLRVLCPWGVTGGPEALHQLVHVARSLGGDARIVYRPATSEVPEPYRIYDVAPIADVEDSDETVVVAPEMYFHELLGFRHAAAVCWWLSWDYGQVIFNEVNQRDVLHACQSYYAFDMLRRRLRRPEQLAMLSDFTRAEFLDDEIVAPREDLAALFPHKGWEFGAQIVAANPDIDFVRIEGMTPQQVRQTLLRAKVYVDFGLHPGKDRVPREAAACGCCVITSSDRGASQYFEDIPIPRSYKHSTRDFSAVDVGDAVRACISDYEQRIGDFALYRAVIQGERLTFEEQVYRLMDGLGCLTSTGS